MKAKRLLRSGWFWAAALVLGVTVAVFGYTLSLRSAADRLVQQQLQAARDLIAILAGIREPADLETAWPKLLEHQERGKTLEAEVRHLPKPSPQFQQELSERYRAAWEAIRKDFAQQMQRIEDDIPGGKEFCAKLEGLSQTPVPSLIYDGQSP